jgi:hypothetical protein
MDINKLLSISKSSNETLVATVSFKLDPKDKEDLISLCAKNGLSVGLLLRNITKDTLDELRKLK